MAKHLQFTTINCYDIVTYHGKYSNFLLIEIVSKHLNELNPTLLNQITYWPIYHMKCFTIHIFSIYKHRLIWMCHSEIRQMVHI